ncbi:MULTISPECIES: oligopeptide transporter, OPT family [unclassified Sphingomonas]|uniref:OPT family oligopeptide transporter n=1 Tax=unclassified Sphingomonas TaxID=196159 RepID=UPI000FF5D5A8|nr:MULTISPECIES: oligopeptide transporter, OPT family [unclassified Sphingomonas]RKE44686.1 putative OPT family oligopeptide transporter [Sphingomonas sp. PP-CC-1A-547]TCM06244.1 putative OPT family oligopeptide transporter [Sphingomonas sp. PP-CC-3G-468]
MTDATRGVTDTGPETSMRELTFRGIVLGGIITLLFTAANVYLGLKIGLTFATSIPAAVISMAVLRLFKDSTILENNIVQTIASAAGTLAAIIFVLPGLVMIGWWQGFPFFTTAAITMFGGVLGVLFSVPLRRALVVDTLLPYPEGRAAAEVLKVGAGSREGGEESARGLGIIVANAVVSAGFAILTQTKLAAAEAATWFRVGAGATGISGGLSFALLGAGHLVGISVGMAMFAGVVIGWWILLPILTSGGSVTGTAEVIANTVFRSDVRFFGAGVIGVAAIWTLLKIAGPVVGGVRSALAASAAKRGGEVLALEERDIPIGIVGIGSLAMLVPIGILLWTVLLGGPLEASAIGLIAGSLVFILVIGLVIAAVCGYMAGLIGASNSPVSGIGILAILAASILLVSWFGRAVEPGTTQALVAYGLIVTGIVFGIATISNDNLQDLKTGQLVGATPWKQQVALLIGVVFGSIVVPPVLNLLGSTLGFAGAPGAGPNALAAPQAALISALAKGVLGGNLNWAMIAYGALTGVLVIAVDELLGKAGKLRLPPLGVGLGVYLPMSVTLPVTIGAVVGFAYDRWADRARDPELAKRMGVLTATGMIVGESLWGVGFAGIVYLTNKETPLAIVGDGFASVALVGGTLLFAVLTWVMYRRTMAASR